MARDYFRALVRERHPLEDWLYYPLHDYRTAKACGMKYATARARKRCLELIAQIKGRK
jgi:hypothetical protein